MKAHYIIIDTQSGDYENWELGTENWELVVHVGS